MSTEPTLVDYQSLIEQLPIAAVVCDSDQLIQYSNSVAKLLFTDGIDAKLDDLISIASESPHRATIKSSPEVQFQYTCHEIDDSHKVHYFSPDCARQQQLTQVAAIGDFAGRVAHDVNNALNSIFGYLDLLSMQLEDDEDAMGYINEATGGANKALDLMQAISRLAGYVPSGDKIPLHELIESLVAVIAEKAEIECENVNANIKLDLSAEKQFVIGEDIQLNWAIECLVKNAIEATACEEGPEVLVSLSTSNYVVGAAEAVRNNCEVGEYVVIQVSDSGKGINAKEFDSLILPFYSSKERSPGVGLGLTSVATTLRAHGGFVKIESCLGAGSSISCYLPVEED